MIKLHVLEHNHWKSVIMKLQDLFGYKIFFSRCFIKRQTLW